MMNNEIAVYQFTELKRNLEISEKVRVSGMINTMHIYL